MPFVGDQDVVITNLCEVYMEAAATVFLFKSIGAGFPGHLPIASPSVRGVC